MNELTDVLKQIQDDLRALKARVDKIEPREIDSTSVENILDNLDLVTDAGTANPGGGILNMLGGTNIGTTGAGDTIAIDVIDSKMVRGYGFNNNGNLWTIAAGAGVWETDPALLVNINVNTACELMCIGVSNWVSNNIRTSTIQARCLLDGVTGGASSGPLGMAVANTWECVAIVNEFPAIAGAHTVTFQALRANAADTVSLRFRRLWVVALEL